MQNEIEIMKMTPKKFRQWMQRYDKHWQYHLVCFLARDAWKITVSEGNSFTAVVMEHEQGDVFWNPEDGFQPDCKDVIIGILWQNFDGETI